MNNLETIYKAFKSCYKISTDTRQDVNDSVFFALSGDNFDGNKFAQVAIEKGAKIAIIDNVDYQLNNNYILVDDALKALQELANHHRKSLGTKILAITGSNGKTTTKELVSAVLTSEKITVCTKGNFNNHIGVPLSLLHIRKDTEIAVIEMGANHIGEIKRLCEIALPDLGIITNIGKAHLEGFGSYEGVIKAKNELYDFLRNSEGEIIQFNDDELLLQLGKGIKSFSYGKKADISGEVKETNPSLKLKWSYKEKDYHINSSLYGSYNFPNIMAAIAVGIYFGIKADNISKAIESYKPINNRSQVSSTENNSLILDAYNANPVSMVNAIKSFKDFNSKNPVLILGDMFELGDNSKEEHKKIIDLLIDLKFNKVFLVGKEFHKLKGTHNFKTFTETQHLKEFLAENRLKKNSILIKGSRGMKLESLEEIL